MEAVVARLQTLREALAQRASDCGRARRTR